MPSRSWESSPVDEPRFPGNHKAECNQPDRRSSRMRLRGECRAYGAEVAEVHADKIAGGNRHRRQARPRDHDVTRSQPIVELTQLVRNPGERDSWIAQHVGAAAFTRG